MQNSKNNFITNIKYNIFHQRNEGRFKQSVNIKIQKLPRLGWPKICFTWSITYLCVFIFENAHKPLTINYIPTPEDIRDKYQYFTEANMNKLHTEGYNEKFYSLEEGIEDYIRHYLKPSTYYWVKKLLSVRKLLLF